MPLSKKFSISVLLILLVLASNALAVDRITDFRNKTSLFSEPPHRILPLMPALAEALIDLGSGAHIVGAPEYTSLPPTLKSQVKIIGPYPRLSAEVIHSLKPDVVIASMDGNESTLISQLESLGDRVIVVNTTSLDEITKTLEILAKLSGHKKEPQVLTDLKSELNRPPLTFKKGVPGVFVQIGWDPLITVSSQTFIGELITKTGARNVFHQSLMKYPKINAEEIIAQNPDVIIICRLTPTGNEVERALKFWKKFKQMNAVKNNRIYVMPMDWLTKPGFALTKGMRELRRVL